MGGATWGRYMSPRASAAVADQYEDFTADAPCQDFYFRQILSGPHENFHYVVGDPATRRAFVVDPTFHLDKLFATVERDGFRITDALFTHGHWDHIGGVPAIFSMGVERMHIHRAAADQPKVREAGGAAHLVDDGDAITVGNLTIEALHTPGHQPESTCFRLPGAPDLLFAGDTLFVGTCGRTDFPGGDTEAMFASMARLRDLPDGTIVLPGHHYDDAPHATVGHQKIDNRALATTDWDDFQQLACLRD